MSTVSDVIAFLEKFAPPVLAEGWDNVGLLVGREAAEVARIMTCLTLTPDVVAEAVQRNVSLVVSHHPVLFRGTKKITDVTSEGRMLLELIENEVSVYSPHTCFDSAEQGINHQLAESFGLHEIQPLRPHESVEDLGSGRTGRLAAAVPLTDFLGTVRSAVGSEYVEFSGSLDAPVTRVAVACGAAAEFLTDAIQCGCDTFVTGEARFHSALEARTEGVNLILLGHYASERPAVEQLAKTLAAEFCDTEVLASSEESDPLSIFMQ
ncbi:MAG: Nif3-like dinuclear metal center hexameric protein [Fuerstiella sp.]|nr:Nif3-like dinuclear metal center hexameric protein [Fuerstiella sp.]MCP4505710.1 Nif3-like dinuclear metal center hexameric protein [Fuerstiella sp.]